MHKVVPSQGQDWPNVVHHRSNIADTSSVSVIPSLFFKQWAVDDYQSRNNSLKIHDDKYQEVGTAFKCHLLKTSTSSLKDAPSSGCLCCNRDAIPCHTGLMRQSKPSHTKPARLFGKGLKDCWEKEDTEYTSESGWWLDGKHQQCPKTCLKNVE